MYIVPSSGLTLCSILLNHITIQKVELSATISDPVASGLIVNSILHSSITLSSILQECMRTPLPQEVTLGILNVALG